MEKNRYQIMCEQAQEHLHKRSATEIITVHRRAAHIIRKNRIVVKDNRYGDTVTLEVLKPG